MLHIYHLQAAGLQFSQASPCSISMELSHINSALCASGGKCVVERAAFGRS